MTRARDVANILTAASALATDVETAAAISAHNSTTTSVHGIPNTANLATENFVLNNKGVNKGNTASRPVSPTIGDIYYNTELRDLEQYTEDGWLIVAKQPPRIPTIGSASLDENNNASVSFTPSAYGQPVSSYTVQSNPGSFTATGSSSPISISGTNLQVGTSYTFRVKSSGTYGDSLYSGYTSSSVVPIDLGNYESIATVTVGSGGAANVEFTSIPSTYTHLQIRGNLRASNGSVNGITVNMRFNYDTGSNYSWHLLGAYQGASAAMDIGASSNANAMNVGAMPNSGLMSNLYSGSIIDILDYTDINKYKTVRSLQGYDFNGSTTGYSYLSFLSGNWRSTNAVTSITLLPASDNFAQYSQFALYGIKSGA
jgi:hypothetical protein